MTKPRADQLAELYDLATKRLAAAGDVDADYRCMECPYRAGTARSSCPETHLAISRCAAERKVLRCPRRHGQLCDGWVATLLGLPKT